MTKSGKAVHLQNQISPTLGKRLGLTRHRSSKSEDMAADGQRSEAVTEAKQRESGVRGGTRVVGDELHMNIASSLNRIEAEVLHVMVEAVKMSKSNTVVRVAGGWVRDKLLNLENEDIDIALDDCTGVAFAELVNAYLLSQGHEAGKVAVIEANPEQSKHLSTARMKIMGVWIDLVNLRTETYKSDSRIPAASFGTAEEDALRRDFTLNALFFNVNEAKLEDMTGSGVKDLRDGIIRTPLPPMVTFHDDPLRLLRAVRFAARFGFTLHDDIRTAAQDKTIQTALGSKVSRERVGAEVSGMLTGKMAQPALALSLLEELGLAAAVYAPPKHLDPPPPTEGYDWAYGAAVARAAAHVLAVRKGLGNAPDMNAPQELESKVTIVDIDEAAASRAALDETETAAGKSVDEKTQPQRKKVSSSSCSSGERTAAERPETLARELFLCAALMPMAGAKHEVKKRKLVSAVQSVVQESLKLKAKEAKNVGEILDHYTQFRALAGALAAKTSTYPSAAETKAASFAPGTESLTEFSRLAVGLAVRQARELWPTCVDLCCATEIVEARERSSLHLGANTGAVSGGKRPRADRENGEVEEGTDADGDVAQEAVINKYLDFEKAVAGMGLERAWEMAPLARGNELMTELHVSKGPEIGRLMVKQASWQLEHPDGTREECIKFLKGTC